MKGRKAQAAFEYLSTYGWGIMAALIAVGALAYFGFLNPSNLLPNRCDFGTQLECTDYRILADDALVSIKFRNNFGKDINITGVAGVDSTFVDWEPEPLSIPVGATRELNISLNKAPNKGSKQELAAVITFKRANGDYPEHNITGSIFVTAQ